MKKISCRGKKKKSKQKSGPTLLLTSPKEALQHFFLIFSSFFTGKMSIYTDSYHPESMKRILEIEAPKLPAPEMPEPMHQAPHFITHLQNLSDLKEGQTAHLECTVQPAADPNMVVEWFHNGQPLSAGQALNLNLD